MSDKEFDAINRLTSRKLTQPRNTSLVQIASLPTSTVENPIVTEATSDKATISQEEISAGMLRIETSINANIQTLCTQRKISRDTFVEAAWVILERNPSVLDDVIEEAQKRYKKRKAKGNARRAKSMEKYKDSE